MVDLYRESPMRGCRINQLIRPVSCVLPNNYAVCFLCLIAQYLPQENSVVTNSQRIALHFTSKGYTTVTD